MTQASANVDHAEISKFEQLAARWWDPDSEFKTLHDINPLRLAFIERKVELQGKQVLDVGCGGGILSEAMAARGAKVTGIDMGEMPLRIAELHTLETGVQVDYRQTSAEALAEETPASFDVITCMELLEHVPEPASVVRACARLVRPGGYLFFSTLNRNPKSYLFAVLGAEYLLNMLPKGTHDYTRFLRPSELARFARAADLQIDEISGMTYNPLTQVYHLDSKDISVNYLLSCQRPA
ncbi:bifunctional 2-polyprenyl-6-hydroxyphenol methylase/3-demethylubiquinol 3-O-methyltransferase UbiG [Thiorhodovibrio frisius]|uniref:Ubiquinone biosynthesis O-methyltransferase n=1 Tax=Thiorhodovibrio frisius TaxID=631362 RepID=H8YY25_9GAMM|nr:bifunctional 2-polyprenyl-6-hydroxyphenol methylase/3-demethylubiquinol 3-O-methyltransferase UbiG [Thiorhodovibrio frisius]EIC23351.1 ubiquinone biosynthesis O-methyltransferase [Thiorhodovibrio frisius]WPL23569.1 3-demethylubiquinone-9 3-methyltransferase [Thiorhodovibrio frisius]